MAVTDIVPQCLVRVCFSSIFLRWPRKAIHRECAFSGYFNLQSTLVISNSNGLYEILRDIHTSTYQICRIEEEEKIIRTTTFNKYICNWTLEVRNILKILWKRGEIAS